MPTYELMLIMRTMAKPELVATIKRTAQSIFDQGGFIRKLENLGTKALPYKVSHNGLPYRQGSYFFFEFDAPPTAIEDLQEEYSRDVDIIKRHWLRKDEPEKFECTLHEELLPPAYRKDVAEMIETAKNSKRTRQERKRTGWSSNTGLDYYPFQR